MKSKQVSILRFFYNIKLQTYTNLFRNKNFLLKSINSTISTSTQMESFNTYNNFNTFNTFNTYNSFYKSSLYNFAKGDKDKNSKKAKIEKEKNNIHKEYDSVSTDDLKIKYKESAEKIIESYKESIAEIQMSKTNPRVLDSIPVLIKTKKLRLSDVATVTSRGANVLIINPFDESHKESIIKGVESSKLDLQIKVDGANIVVNLGDMPSELKNECLSLLKKLSTKSIDLLKDIRHNIINEIKKLEKIIGKDEAKKLEKNILQEVFEKNNKLIEQLKSKKEEEIRSC